MGFKPSLTEAQWSKVSALLPEKRRGRQMIEAVLYRTHTGESLATVSEAFGIKKARLHQWEHAITHELPAIMAALRLERAGPLAWCRSGSRPTYHNNPDMMASIDPFSRAGCSSSNRMGTSATGRRI